MALSHGEAGGSPVRSKLSHTGEVMKRYFGRFVVGALLLIAACAARAQDFGTPRLLIAAPGTQGTYERTVLIAIPVSGGHAGVVLNRLRDVGLASLMPANAPAAKIAAPVSFGGPLGSKVAYAMVRRDPGAGAKRLFGGIYMTTGSGTIERIVEQMPQDARFFSGMAVWLPGELEAQIEAGEWIEARPEASMVFPHDAGAMWSDLVARFGETRTALK
jgi:putative transcriptional regulator